MRYIPDNCPGCGTELYPIGRRKPELTLGWLGRALLVLSVVMTGGLYLAGMSRFHSRVEQSEFPISNAGIAIAAAILFVPALVPGLVVGYLAYRMPKVFRLRCRKCGWRECVVYNSKGSGDRSMIRRKLFSFKAEADPFQNFDPSTPPAPPSTDDAEHVSFESEAEQTSSPFGQFLDDGGAYADASAWSYREIANGRSPEDVEADLLAQGWSSDAAAEIAEQARRKTRHLRA